MQKVYICKCNYESKYVTNMKKHLKKCKYNSNSLVNHDLVSELRQSINDELPWPLQYENMPIELGNIQKIIDKRINQKLFSITNDVKFLSNLSEQAQKIYQSTQKIMKPAIISNIFLLLQQRIENDPEFKINIHKIAHEIANLFISTNLSTCIKSFIDELTTTHKLIQLKSDKSTRTFKNNQKCFQFIKKRPEIQFRNSYKILNMISNQSKFTRQQIRRYFNLLKRNNIFFQGFPQIPKISEQVLHRTRVVPISLIAAGNQLQKIFQTDKILASDMWTLMTLGLRSTDLKKIIYFPPQGFPAKIIKLQQKKTKNIIFRFIPESLIRLVVASKADYPMNDLRLKIAVSTCLRLFGTAYGFKHRTITQIISALANRSKFVQFHRKISNTFSYYLDKNDEKLINSSFQHGITFVFRQQIEAQIRNKNALINLTGQIPQYECITQQKLNQITIDGQFDVSERIVNSIMDDHPPSSQQLSLVKQQHLGQIFYMRSQYNRDSSESQQFDSIEESIVSVSNASCFQSIESYVLEKSMSTVESKQEIYRQAIQNLTSKEVDLIQFNQQQVEPDYLVKSQNDSANKAIITAVKNQRRHTKFKISIDEGQLSLVRRALSIFNKEKCVILNKTPKCEACRQQNKISFLSIGIGQIECQQCNFKQKISFPQNKIQKVQIVSLRGSEFPIGLKQAKQMPDKNNIKSILGHRFGFQNIYSANLPKVLQCNFMTLDHESHSFQRFKSKFDFLPFEIKSSLIPNAGKGMFTRCFLHKDTLISYYNGEVKTNFQLNPKSDSIFKYGWYKIQNNWFELNCDGNITNCGSRFVNTHCKAEKINIATYKAVYKGNFIVVFIAKRDIQSGEELYLNYGDYYNLNLEMESNNT